jgi:hypothetical protein
MKYSRNAAKLQVGHPNFSGGNDMTITLDISQVLVTILIFLIIALLCFIFGIAFGANAGRQRSRWD